MKPPVLVEVRHGRTELLPENGDIGHAQSLHTVDRVSEGLSGEGLQNDDGSRLGDRLV